MSGFLNAFLASSPLPIPVFEVDFTKIDSLPAQMVHSRASHATYFDSTGKLTYAPNNMQINSSNLSAWGTESTTLTTGQDDPFGGTTAVLMTGTGVSFSSIYGNSPYTGTVIVSFYVKAGTQTKCELWDVGGFSQAKYDLSAVSASPTGGGNGADSAGISDVGGGWFRIWYKKSSPTYVAYPRIIQGWDAPTVTTTLYVAAPQQEAVTYQTTPRAYVASTSAAYYGPRIDYDPSALTRKGMLTEGEAMNRVLHSGDLTNAAWTKRNSSASTGTTDAPDGVVKMTSVNFTNIDGAIYQLWNTDVTAGQVFTVSFWAKAGTASQLYAGINGETQSQNNISGSLITVTSTPTRYYVSVTVATNDTGIYFILGGGINAGGGDNLPSTGTIEIWGVQAESGSRVTSYIPTSTASVTRENDFYRLDLAGLTSNYTQFVKGTWSLDGELINGTSNGVTNSSEVYMTSGGITGYAYKAAGGSNTRAITPTPNFVDGDLFAAVNAYGPDIFKLAVNGSYNEIALSGPVNVPEKFHIGNYNGTGGYNAASHVKKVAIYNNTFTQYQMRKLSSL